jgi:hypothetical protein
VNYLGTEAATEYLGALAITPLGFGTNRKEYTRMSEAGNEE